MNRWIIFNFYDGDFIRQNGVVISFETKGLARQFLERYRKPKPLQKTKEFTVNYSCYEAPFRFVREGDHNAV
ncbi:hypothetical protein [Streptococcus ovis]|uniref:hypothetical protein n=1 Tax=Streptococcus ovis TaxID=82806 RepID=UPI0003654623|nr:hypothetical protein [Streptococcus ovis]